MLLNILPWVSRLKIRYNKCDQIRIDPDNIQAIHILYFTNTQVCKLYFKYLSYVKFNCWKNHPLSLVGRNKCS